MATQVRFFKGTKAQYLALSSPRNQDALYFCIDTQELYMGDLLLSDGIRVVPTCDDLPELSCAADGIVYYVHDSHNAYMVSPDRTEWLQTIYAPAMDAYEVPESEVYKTVTTVGAVRDIEKKIYDRMEEIVQQTPDLDTATKNENGLMSANDKRVVDSLPSVYVARQYEISGTPIGTLVDYRDHEIRIMCPAGTKFVKQNVGANGKAFSIVANKATANLNIQNTPAKPVII